MITEKTRRHISTAALLLGAFLLSAGIQAQAVFTPPTTTPPNADAYAPLTTSPTVQSKVGGLLLNTGGAVNGLLVQNGNVGIGTMSPTEKLDVAGYVKGTGLCMGTDCRTSWSAATAPIYETRQNGSGGNATKSVACQAGWTMTGGGCWCLDASSGGDSSAYGGRPSGNAWQCMATSASGCSGGLTAYVRCAKY